ncbi:MAG TPA: Wzz/FepE/Etk N-terminal domain-containing protein [Actinomycetota bacterium]|jgi:hypothetical protein
MELKQYWRRAGRRRWILVVVPGLVAVATVPVALRQPPRYTATATVVLQPNEAVPSPPSVNQVIADFQSLVASQPLLDRVSRQTGEPVEALRRDLNVKQIGAGNLAELSYEGTRPATATGVVQAAGSIGYDMLYGSRVAAATEQLEFARKYYEDVLAAKRTRTSGTSGTSGDTSPLPERDYEIKSQALSDLRLQRAQAQLDGQTARAKSLDRLIAGMEQELSALGPQIDTHTMASEDEQRASAVVDQAQQQLVLLEGLRGYRTSGAVTTSPAHALPLLHDRVETLARSVLLAVLLAAGILTLLELVWATTRPEGAADRAARGPATVVSAGPPGALDNGRDTAWLHRQH